MAEHGFANLGMDRIAEAMEYSKGTIYQHFQCKEEVLMQLCMRGLRIWGEFFDRALAFRGNSRERLQAFHLGHDYYARLYPVEYEASYTVKSAGVRDKISADNHAAHNALLKEVLDRVVVVVDEAIAAGDLSLPRDMRPQDLVYGFWAVHYGELMMENYNFGYGAMGIGNRESTVRTVLRALLDGLGWRPLSSQHDFAAVAERIGREVFPQEVARLAGREGEQAS
ncbi:TetR/AcrR family transcriptional regulator [Methylogaea oryzae]|uniref:TetR/AcrR family transcriptional regulator n=1 Tax=Methylogaea oryzae TaxID=1295382 RepID=UPI0020D150F3|nr:TetR/AcrR family transcriptional regulator [Methylogaea oryzae]